MDTRTDTLPAYLSYALAVLWLWSGVQPVLTATQPSLDLLAALGVPAPWQWPLLLAASAWDVLLGLVCVLPQWRRRALIWGVHAITVAAYSLIVAVGLPEYWLHPFAPLLKNLPILALMVYLYQHYRARQNTV